MQRLQPSKADTYLEVHGAYYLLVIGLAALLKPGRGFR